MKSDCPYSLAAKQRLQQLRQPVEIMVVPPAQLEHVKRAHHMDTFPQIFLVDESQQPPKRLIGGYDDLMNYLAVAK